MSVFRDEVSFIEIPACTKTNVKVCLTVFLGGRTRLIWAFGVNVWLNFLLNKEKTPSSVYGILTNEKFRFKYQITFLGLNIFRYDKNC